MVCGVSLSVSGPPILELLTATVHCNLQGLVCCRCNGRERSICSASRSIAPGLAVSPLGPFSCAAGCQPRHDSALAIGGGFYRRQSRTAVDIPALPCASSPVGSAD